MTDKPICSRCGLCCCYELDCVLKQCRYLVKLSSGRSLCRVYRNRLNKVLDIHDNGDEVRCMMREDDPYDYPGCPYNTNKPMFGDPNE